METAMTEPDEYPTYESHFIPRTRDGKLAVFTFVVVLALAEPPLVFLCANRIEPALFGMPFLFGYLLFVYSALIVLLIAAARRAR